MHILCLKLHLLVSEPASNLARQILNRCNNQRCHAQKLAQLSCCCDLVVDLLEKYHLRKCASLLLERCQILLTRAGYSSNAKTKTWFARMQQIHRLMRSGSIKDEDQDCKNQNVTARSERCPCTADGQHMRIGFAPRHTELHAERERERARQRGDEIHEYRNGSNMWRTDCIDREINL